MNKRFIDGVLDVTTLVVGVAAVTLAGMLLWDRVATSQPASGPAVIREVEDWGMYASGGRRVGGEVDPALTIIEFGDYQCSFCREFHGHINAVLRRHPEDVAFVYRHAPIPGNSVSYSAARVAECAGEQGRFWETHSLLLRETSWAGDALNRVGVEAGVADMPTYIACISDSTPVPAVERDLALARQLDVPGTPTVLLNENLHYGVVDSLFLFQTVAHLLTGDSPNRQ